jgi:hypothetical protein
MCSLSCHGDDLVCVAENPAPRLGSLAFVVEDHWHLKQRRVGPRRLGETGLAIASERGLRTRRWSGRETCEALTFIRHGQHGGHLRVLENSGTSTQTAKVGDDNDDVQHNSKLLSSHLRCTSSMEFLYSTPHKYNLRQRNSLANKISSFKQVKACVYYHIS